MNTAVQRRYQNMVGSFGLPQQSVSSFEKNKPEWIKACMDYFDYQSATQSREKTRIKENYDLVNGIHNPKNYQYVTDPLSLGDKKDSQYGTTQDVIHYPIMNQPIQTIIGEYINRPLNFFVVNESDHARNEWVRTKTEMLQTYVTNKIQSRIQARLKAEGLDPASEQGQQAAAKMTPQDIQDYMDKDYIDVAEQTSQRIVNTIWREESLDDKFTEGFKHAVVSAREFYHTYTCNGRVKVRDLSPLDVFYHRSPSVRWISEGQFAGFRWYLTPSSIIDLFYDNLSVSDVEALEALINPNVSLKKATGNGTGVSSIVYNTSTFSDMHGTLSDRFNNQMLEEMVSNFQLYGSNSTYMSTFGLIKVVQAYWKSLRKVGFLTYYDQYDRPQETIVDDNYEANKGAGEHISYRYINQVYKGAKIGDDIYVNTGPYTDNILDIENLDYCPLPIEGCTYNDTNSRPLSLVDLMRPWNELYNIVAYELRKDMNSSLGKVLFMSTDHIPNIPGFTWDKWYYWARELKIAWVKSPARGGNTFNQFSAADMSFAQQMATKMDTLQRIKAECDSMAGFSQPRIGASAQQNTLGESRQAFVASVNQTEYYFFKHNKLVERVLQYALNLARKAEAKYGVMRNRFNDLEQAYIMADGQTLTGAKLSLYVTNSAKDHSTRQKIEQLLQFAVSNGADVKDASEILMAQTISETTNLFNKLRRKQAEAEQARNAHEEKLQQMVNDDKAKQREHDQWKIEGTWQNNLDREVIKTFGGRGQNMMDSDGNGMADMMEYEDMAADRSLKFRQMNLQERKQYMDEMFRKEDVSIKREGLEVKREDTAAKERIAKRNKNKYD